MKNRAIRSGVLNNRALKIRGLAIFAILLMMFTLFVPVTAFADEGSYRAVVQDDADLFSDWEEQELMDQISELLGYGNMGIVTNEAYNSDAAQLARSKYIETFGETNGLLFLIDMYNRRIQIFSGGSVYRTISTAKANEITDNVYTHATAGSYYRAASKAFEQIKITLEGGRIVTPMRFATNAAFAIGIVLLINFIIINSQRKKNKKANMLTNALYYNTRDRKNSVVRGVQTVMTSQRKRKHVESSGGGGGFSGGGGGGGFSGGGGGGGFSGGGGGHSF